MLKLTPELHIERLMNGQLGYDGIPAVKRERICMYGVIGWYSERKLSSLCENIRNGGVFICLQIKKGGS
ncbi:MAG: hypothetical protein LBI03_05275 [Clostridiales bacterium]|nr:hypothetical protein [Clostridiales bacterium]